MLWGIWRQAPFSRSILGADGGEYSQHTFLRGKGDNSELEEPYILGCAFSPSENAASPAPPGPSLLTGPSYRLFAICSRGHFVSEF